MYEDNYKTLANAIIQQAIVDYGDALKTQAKTPEHEKRLNIIKQDCVEFFLSDWYGALSEGLSGSEIIRQIQHNAANTTHRISFKTQNLYHDYSIPPYIIEKTIKQKERQLAKERKEQRIMANLVDVIKRKFYVFPVNVKYVVEGQKEVHTKIIYIPALKKLLNKGSDVIKEYFGSTENIKIIDYKIGKTPEQRFFTLRPKEFIKYAAYEAGRKERTLYNGKH